MTDITKKAYNDYIALSAQIKALTAQKKAAEDLIKEYHKTTGLSIITEDGFSSKLIDQTVTSLSKEKLVKKFGADAIADCFETTSKTNFRCRLLND